MHTAQEQGGARALVLYSDPADDGSAKGPVWPDGYWRGPDMLQRGNAKLSWFWHGDPLTPGVGATAEAVRLDPEDRADVAAIPVVVLSAREARARAHGARRPRTAGGVPRCASTAPRASGPDPRPLTRLGRHGRRRAPDLQRRRVAARHRPRRSGRCSSARTTTRGPSAASIPAPAPPRCWSWPAASASSPAAAGARSAPSRWRSGTPRSSAWSAPPSTPRR